MKPVASRALSLLMFAVLLALHSAATVVAPAHAATIERVSLASDGTQANNYSWGGTVSADGRFVAFVSRASNLVPGDTNDSWDVFVHDRVTHATERVNIADNEAQANGGSAWAAISADGRFVAFPSGATNLVPGDTNGYDDVFVRDRVTGTTERVSVSSDESQANDSSRLGDISGDGRSVAFFSSATNLVSGDTNAKYDVFVRDRVAGTTERVSVAGDGSQASGNSMFPSINSDGRFVAFESVAANLVPYDYNLASDIFVRDRLAQTTERIAAEAPDIGLRTPDISADGRFVAFTSGPWEPEVCSCDRCNVFSHDRVLGETTSLDCAAADYEMCSEQSISADGRYVSFSCTDYLGRWSEQFHWAHALRIHDRLVGEATTIIAGDWDITVRNNDISADGRFVVFEYGAGDLVPGDTNGLKDVFVLDRGSGQPPQPWIGINGAAPCTNSTSVTLALQFPAECASMRFRNDPGDWGAWEPCVFEKPWVLPSGDGVKTVCMQCRDALGNPCGEACDDIVLDTTPPTGLSITIEWGADCTDYPDEAQLHISAADAAFRRFRNDGGDWSAWEQNTELPWYGKYWALSEGRGLKTVYFQCRDSCGNESAVVSDTIWVPTFVDLLCADSQRPYIEALAREGITAGCRANPPTYCRLNEITRAQMAVFLCRAAGKGPLDLATPTFCDVPRTNPYYGWIERIADPDSWNGNPPTIGCTAFPCKQYCPSQAVTRDEMAAFLVRATGKLPMPSCSGIFSDVGTYWACPYTERLVDTASWPGGIAVTSGCATNPPRYCPKSAVTRGQLAVFLVRAFGIPL